MKIVYVYDSIARIGGMERILTDKMKYLAEIMGTRSILSLLPKAIILFLSRYPTKWNISIWIQSFICNTSIRFWNN